MYDDGSMSRTVYFYIRYAIYIVLSLQLLSCTVSSPNEKELIDTVEKYYGINDTEYNFKAKIIRVEETGNKKSIYSHIGRVNITHIKTGKSFKVQFGLKKDGGTWVPNDAQLKKEATKAIILKRHLEHFKDRPFSK